MNSLPGSALLVMALTALPISAQERKWLEGTGTGTIRGKVTLDGTAPGDVKVPINPKHTDYDHCMKGDLDDLTWVVGPGNALANVVVYLVPPAKSSFKVDLSKKTWPDEVVIDQPFCAFKPHVSVVFPEYDGQPTGQKFIVKNSAPILHNVRIAGSAFRSPARSETLLAGQEKQFKLRSDHQPLTVRCDVHRWMAAYLWSFDHPFAAVSKADGTFEIKNVPLGAELTVMAWHEMGTPGNGREIRKGALKDGDRIDFSIRK
ncbi:MAG: hypothetical protein K1X57_08965 [Gemmataceae bacterium]|nr:hypothetical protein [Gemmataceae bacterium]